MGWVREIVKQRIAEQAQRSTPIAPIAAEPLSILGEIAEHFQSAVAEYNEALGDRFEVATKGKSLLQVIPRQPPIATAVVELDGAVIRVVCPPVGMGINRHGIFREVQGKLAPLGDFVGSPQPPAEPMTPEEFSRFVLEPIFFPAAE